MAISGINPTLLKPKSINYPTRKVMSPDEFLAHAKDVCDAQKSSVKKLPLGKIAAGAIAVAGAILAALKIKQNADNKKENA